MLAKVDVRGTISFCMFCQNCMFYWSSHLIVGTIGQKFIPLMCGSVKGRLLSVKYCTMVNIHLQHT